MTTSRSRELRHLNEPVVDMLAEADGAAVKPSAKEAALAKEGELDLAISLMTKRLKVHPATARLVLRPLFRHVRTPVAIDGLAVTVDHKGNVEVKIHIDGLDILVMKGHHCEGGIFSEYTSSLGLRRAVHQQVDGCDEKVALRKGVPVTLKRCTRGGHVG